MIVLRNTAQHYGQKHVQKVFIAAATNGEWDTG